MQKLLIANRGEIACRVMRTARAMGLRTVAVFSEVDGDAPHVRMADQAYLIGPAPAQESYLDMDRILDVAAKSGADAVHPGYGFLSENAVFAERATAAGLTFVGPPAEAIRAMGQKATAKAMMEQAEVPVVPGYHGSEQDPDFLSAEADKIGYPVLIKAVAGGGGKGMRRVDDPAKFAKALQGARREAQSSFGDDLVLLERYIEKPRHIEIQVFADGHGNVVHLFERDCSLQRRHQKVIEEAPAPGMAPELRARMGDAAVAAARAIGYVGAGTVEFIADVADGLRADGFFFMEMNTRLQVEHPVTEMITGQDLVEWQLRVAAGEALPLAQADISLTGHAMEFRVYAENPARKFLPSTGRLARFRLPTEDRSVRVDSGVAEGGEVTPYYDPMIAKLVVHGEDRRGAIRRAEVALEAFQIAGVTTNLDFLRRVVRHGPFGDADLDTGFIERHAEVLLVPPPTPDARILALSALVGLVERQTEQSVVAGDPHSPWGTADGWRLNDEGHDSFEFLFGEESHMVGVRYRRDGRYELTIGDTSLLATGALTDDGVLTGDLDGERVKAAVAVDGDDLHLLVDGATYRLTRHDPLHGEIEDDIPAASINAPLPGKIVQVLVESGATVTKGEALLVLEAMKMEHTITAPAEGRVAKVNFSAGDQVDEGDILLAFDDEG
jgi:3-methylcrotonyl-CoA carboxylase alpha subunit